jgi:4'-phosphopantetheinyl transferase
MGEDPVLCGARSGLRRVHAEDEFELWLVDIDASDLDPGVLSADEEDRACRFVRAEDRRRFRMARTALRHLLAAATGLSASDIGFEAGHRGKPYLAGGSHLEGGGRRLDFNVSHSGDFALIGIARGRAIGVDIEVVRESIDELQLARTFFCEAEFRRLDALQGAAQLRLFYQIWTCKEAVLKAFGAGIAERLRDFSVELCPGRYNLHPEQQNLEPGQPALDLASVRAEPLQAPECYTAAFALAPL